MLSYSTPYVSLASYQYLQVMKLISLVLYMQYNTQYRGICAPRPRPPSQLLGPCASAHIECKPLIVEQIKSKNKVGTI